MYKFSVILLIVRRIRGREEEAVYNSDQEKKIIIWEERINKDTVCAILQYQESDAASQIEKDGKKKSNREKKASRMGRKKLVDRQIS